MPAFAFASVKREFAEQQRMKCKPGLKPAASSRSCSRPDEDQERAARDVQMSHDTQLAE